MNEFKYERMQGNTADTIVMAEKISRITKTITIDPRVWEAVERKAYKINSSGSRWLENYLFENFQAMGEIAATERKLGELRGGDQKGGKNS